MEYLTAVEKYDGILGFLAFVVLMYHVVKCDKRSDRVWEKLDDMSKHINKVEGYLEGKSSVQ